MSFQQSVPFTFAAGIPGELAQDGPLRSETMRLIANPAAPTAPIVFGRAFGYASPSSFENPLGATSVAVAIPGGSNFAGILIHPKAHASYGTANGPLTPVFSLPENSWGEIARMCTPFVMITAATAAAGAVGANIGYNAQGELVAFVGALPASTTLVPGARLLTPVGLAPTPVLAKIELTTIAAAVTP